MLFPGARIIGILHHTSKSKEIKNTILITGESRGIGKETAKLFQSKGWNVVATMRNPENETELNQIDNVLVTKLDVLDVDTIQQAYTAGIKRFGGIDVLLNNARYGAYGPLEFFSREKNSSSVQYQCDRTFGCYKSPSSTFQTKQKRYNYQCFICGRKNKFSIRHLIPRY